MAVRTCDLRELLALVPRPASAGRSLVVAVSGFPASGKSTLAARLQERLDGAVLVAPSAVEADDRGLLERLLRGAAREAAVVIVEGPGLLRPAVRDLFDLRVWLDVDLETATERGNLRTYLESRNAGGPVGRWIPADRDSPGVATDPREAALFEQDRPDRTADVLFVPVGRMTPPITIRFLAESGCDFALWDEENEHLGELEDLLPVPADLRDRLKRWADRWFRHDGGEPVPDWPGPVESDLEGHALSVELQEALGPDFRVRYSFSTREARDLARPRS